MPARIALIVPSAYSLLIIWGWNSVEASLSVTFHVLKKPVGFYVLCEICSCAWVRIARVFSKRKRQKIHSYLKVKFLTVKSAQQTAVRACTSSQQENVCTLITLFCFSYYQTIAALGWRSSVQIYSMNVGISFALPLSSALFQSWSAHKCWMFSSCVAVAYPHTGRKNTISSNFQTKHTDCKTQTEHTRTVCLWFMCRFHLLWRLLWRVMKIECANIQHLFPYMPLLSSSTHITNIWRWNFLFACRELKQLSNLHIDAVSSTSFTIFSSLYVLLFVCCVDQFYKYFWKSIGIKQ